jgi:UDP-N-acetylglucosamine acyltransferase
MTKDPSMTFEHPSPPAGGSPNIHPTAIVEPGAKIGEGCTIGPYSHIGQHVSIGGHTQIGSLVVIEGWTEVGSGCQISSHAILGTPPQHLKYQGEETHLQIGQQTVIREFVTINRATVEGGGRTVVGDGNFIMAYSHIGHDCILGNHIIMANGASLGGHVVIEDYANVGGITGVHQFVRIGCHAMVGAYSGIGQDVPPYMMVSGIRAKPYGLNLVGLRRHHFPPQTLKALKEASRILFFSNLNTSQALARIEAEIEALPEIKHLVEFIRASKRGISR